MNTRDVGSRRYEAYAKPLYCSVWSWIAVGAGDGVFDAYIVLQVGTGCKVVQFPLRASELEARLHGVAATSVEIDTPSRLIDGLGCYVDHPRLAEAELGRQGAGQKVDVTGKPGVERLAETGNPLGQDNSVNAVLNISVVTPHMQLAERVIGHAGRLEQDLVEGRVFPLR